MSWFNMHWCEWRDGRGNTFDANYSPLPGFIAAGLSRADLLKALQIAMDSRAVDKWAYFCGVCRNFIRDIHQEARDLLRREDDDG